MKTIRGKKILLVDDNRDSVDMLASLFEIAGYRTAKAYDGYAACEAARRQLPSVIIMDLGMPWMDGYEAARTIRKIPGAGNIPIIAVSGNAGADTSRKASAAGFTWHFCKPLDFDSLSQYLENIS